MAYQFQPYPSVRYHPKHGQRPVKNEEEDKALGAGWTDTPAKKSAALPDWDPNPTAPEPAQAAEPKEEAVPEWKPAEKKKKQK